MVNIGDAHAMKCQGELCSAAAARRSIKERAKKAIAGNRIAPIVLSKLTANNWSNACFLPPQV
jgi:acetamidase/formamidase